MTFGLETLYADLLRDEGSRDRPYRDTVGKLTIGIGHNLDDVPISPRAIRVLWEDDIEAHWRGLQRALPWVLTLDPLRQRVLLNMAFNLGVPGLLAFKTTLEHVRAGRFDRAADAMLHSLWAKQVGARAQRLAAQMRTGLA